MNKKIVLSFGVAVALYTGCGGESSGKEDSNVGVGYYVDAAVAGVDYICGKEKGITDQNGMFTFEKGKDCTFALAGLQLREVKAENLHNEVKIVENRPEVAAFLQSIDIDGDPSNGIDIKPEVLTILQNALKEHNVTTVPTDEKLEIVVDKVKEDVTEFKGKVVTPQKAMEHVKKTQSDILKSLIAGKTFYIVKHNQGEYTLLKGTVNEQVTKLTTYDIDGTLRGENAVHIDGDKLIFQESADNGIYSKFVLQSDKPYIYVTTYSSDDSMLEYSRWYFKQKNAQHFYDDMMGDRKDSDSKPADNLDLKSRLAGKTFYEIDKKSDGTVINKLVFNADFTMLEIEVMTGADAGKKRTVNINFADDRINFKNGESTEFKGESIDYIELADSDGETTRLYFSKTKAEEQLKKSDNTQKPKDTTKPVITLNGDNPLYLFTGENYTEAGARAYDDTDGDLTRMIVIQGNVNTDKAGEYTIRYIVKDSAGNRTEITRKVVVKEKEVHTDNTKPVITLNGDNPLILTVGDTYKESGAKATDDTDGDLTDKIKTKGSIDTTKVGTYEIIYYVSDNAGNRAEITRKVIVKAKSEPVDTIKPIITLKGDNPMILTVGDTYKEPGATATDNKDGDLTGAIVKNGSVDTQKAGTYTLIYSVSDNAGNKAEVTRKVTVKEKENPYASFYVAKDNTVSDVVKVFNGLTVKVLTDVKLGDTPSNDTIAVYGEINGANTKALLKINANYPDGTKIVVQAFDTNGKLVGTSEERYVTGTSPVNFGSFVTE